MLTIVRIMLLLLLVLWTLLLLLLLLLLPPLPSAGMHESSGHGGVSPARPWRMPRQRESPPVTVANRGCLGQAATSEEVPRLHQSARHQQGGDRFGHAHVGGSERFALY